MKTTANERKNTHYVIMQNIIIGDDEYVSEKHETGSLKDRFQNNIADRTKARNDEKK